jgi:outer membrane protein insertion porin family
MGMCVRVRRGLVAVGLLLGVAFFGLAADVALAAESGPAIVVQGNRRVEADTVRSTFRVAPGDHLDAARIDAALKALYASGLFEDVRISQSGGG